MKIAIIGSGISGLFAAHYLSKQHQVTVYEAKTRLGGHTETHALQLDGKVLAVDTGFIVFNELNYPKFCRFLQDLGVASQASDMSFSVANALTGLEYNGQPLDQLFCQRRNLLRPRFYGMVMDILRFYREAPALLLRHDDELTLGDYLLQQGYGQMFIDEHILPLACALWSGPAELLKKFPARYFVAFMANHQMLKTRDRPRWRTVCGGSSTYIQVFLDNFRGDLRVHCPVLAVYREPAGVRVVA
jgi:predicted NAD/FAD-binding protein